MLHQLVQRVREPWCVAFMLAGLLPLAAANVDDPPASSEALWKKLEPFA